MSRHVAIVTRVACGKSSGHHGGGKQDMQDIRDNIVMAGKMAWGKWVRFAKYIDADPYTLMVPALALPLGFFILLFSW